MSLLIVDDHDGFRSFVASMLEGERFSVCGAVEDGAAALDAIARLRPDLVLLDVQLPDLDGFEVAERVAVSWPRTAVILTSTRDAEDFGARLRQAPVAGFVPKHGLSVQALVDLVAVT
ncbi:hypothetical protein GCM10022215_07380 [Nocardioides fonticola]|uniref:Response regulatory domain-containing protein n=1 Tax=Nocardioides fonticola TaxID=450363 RepID=A0ABP7XEV4_9ACTN